MADGSAFNEFTDMGFKSCSDKVPFNLLYHPCTGFYLLPYIDTSENGADPMQKTLR